LADPLVLVERLIALALDGSSVEESRTAALKAVQTMRKHGLRVVSAGAKMGERPAPSANPWSADPFGDFFERVRKKAEEAEASQQRRKEEARTRARAQSERERPANTRETGGWTGGGSPDGEEEQITAARARAYYSEINLGSRSGETMVDLHERGVRAADAEETRLREELRRTREARADGRKVPSFGRWVKNRSGNRYECSECGALISPGEEYFQEEQPNRAFVRIWCRNH